ncbi:MAG: DUF6079 family protein [Acidobacteriota bacterium]
MKVRDLISLPAIKTVVQLRDIYDPVERSRLVRHFVLTEEATLGLRVILEHLIRRQGCGFFLKGHYGSGKSHFLAFLSLILSEKEFCREFLDRFSAKRKMGEALPLEQLLSNRLAILNISLVEYRSDFALEDIVAGSLGEAFPDLFPPQTEVAPPPDGGKSASPPKSRLKSGEAAEGEFRNSEEEPARLSARPARDGKRQETRKKFLDRALESLREKGYHGLLILIDELSEFLRSKPSVRQFNEDIRYLQFVGEFSASQPLWVVAALQEYLEETGEIHQEIFNKIKDRYPVRIALTAGHVKALVGEVLIRKKPGRSQKLRQLYHSFKKSFPSWVVPEDEFLQLYPLHPASIELLEDLKPLFSKTRGFVDFIHYQIAGDPARGIEGMLDSPCEALLCPDRIFDHFLDRMKGTIEILPYIETVYAYYRKEIPHILEEMQDQQFALRLLKLLILQDISPVQHPFTVRELTEMLLERITDLDPEVNYQYTTDTAEQLLRRGGFLVASSVRVDGKEERIYHIQFEANVHSLVERKLEYKRQLLASLGGQAVIRLFPHLVSQLPFFQQLSLGRAEVLILDWQRTRRTGMVCTLNCESSAPQEEWELHKGDFTLVVGLPGQRLKGATAELNKFSSCVGVLLPAQIKETDRCLEALALFELAEEYREDESSQGKRIRQRVESLVQDHLPLVGQVYERSFRQSQLCATGSGEILHQFKDEPSANCLELFQLAVARLLESRFPKHYLIAPQQNYYPQAALTELEEYFRSMSKENFERLRWGRTVLDGFLLPTGLVKRERKEYLFATSAEESAPLALLLSHLASEGPHSARDALRFLGASEFGMHELQFKAFLLAALAGGFLVGLRGGRKLPAGQLDAGRLLEIEQLKAGETISRQATLFLSQLEAVPKKLRKASLSYAECRQCWETIRSLHRQTEANLSESERLSSRYKEYRVFRLLDLATTGASVERAREFLRSVRTSFPALQGLETLVGEVPHPKALNRALRDLQHSHAFLADCFSAFAFVGNYLEQVRPLIPKNPRYQALAEDLDGLWARLQGWDPCGPPSEFRQLQVKFEAWQSLYISAYEEEHQAYHRVEDLSQLRELLKSRELELLARLERLDVFVPDTPSSALREILSQMRGKACSRPVWEELQQRPICTCGFELGQSVHPLPLTPVRDKLNDQLEQFLAQLRHPRFRELLDRFEFHLARRADAGGEADTKSLETTRRLKSVTRVKELVAEEDRLDEAFIRRLNSFEPGRKPFEVKYLSSYRARIGRQPQTRPVLVREFDRWLKEGLSDPDQAIRLVDQPRREDEDEERFLRPLLAACGPELTEAFQKFTREEFLFRLWASDLVLRHGVDADQARGFLPLLPPTDQLATYAQLARKLPAEDSRRLRDSIEGFESRLGEPGYEALGLLPDSASQPARIFVQEAFLPQLIRLSSLRLAKQLVDADDQTLRKLLSQQPGDWRFPDLSPPSNEKDHYRRFLETLLWLRQAEMKFKARDRHTSSPAKLSTKGLETFFLQTASLVPSMLDSMKAYQSQLDCPEVAGSTIQTRLLQHLDHFSETYRRQIQEASRKVPRVEGILKSSTPELLSSLEAASVRLLFVDGLAWPVWRLLREGLRRRMPPHLRIVAEKTAYAHQPSTTLEQVRHWLDAGELQPFLEVQKGFAFQESGREDRVYKIAWVDDKIHSSPESPYFLYREIIEQLRPQLLGFLTKLPRRSLLVLFSDHGFVENPAFQPSKKYQHPRYRHGGGSPFELVVPVVFFYSGRD